MVPRVGYYVDGDCVRTLCRNINWNSGWSKEAKSCYVNELHEEMRKCFGNRASIHEVTSASLTKGRALSPIYMKFSNGESYEDAWGRITCAHVDKVAYDNIVWEKPLPRFAWTHYYCFYSIGYVDLIRSIDVFTDVFYNPTKPGGSQGEGCAILKLLDKTGNMGILGNIERFSKWCEEHVKGVETMSKMFYFTLVGGTVVESSIGVDDPISGLKYLTENVPYAKPVHVDIQPMGSVYLKCKTLIDKDMNCAGHDWFLSADKGTALAACLLSVIESNKKWEVMQSESAFSEWMNNIRR